MHVHGWTLVVACCVSRCLHGLKVLFMEHEALRPAWVVFSIKIF
jgi:hypothetical protein